MADLPKDLQEFVLAKLEALSLPANDDTRDFVAGMLLEDSFEPEVRFSCLSAPISALPLSSTLVDLTETVLLALTGQGKLDRVSARG